MNKKQLKRIIQEAMNDAHHLEQAQVEDVLFECFIDWVIRDPTPSRAGGDLFVEFVAEVSERLKIPLDAFYTELERLIFK